MASKAALVSTGDSSCRSLVCSEFSSKMLPRFPSRVFKLIWYCSRRESMGGLVTWLKFWRKK